MISTGHLQRWLAAPYITGPRAFSCALAAVAVPTLIGMAAVDIVTNMPLTFYIPFILLAALFLGWRYAVGVAIAATITAGFWLIGKPYHFLDDPTDIFKLSSFLLVSMIIIAFTQGMRRLGEASAPQELPAPSQPGAIVFSLKDGVAWASWYGTEVPVRLGPEDEVAAMMEDFLAQCQLGRQLMAARR